MLRFIKFVLALSMICFGGLYFFKYELFLNILPSAFVRDLDINTNNIDLAQQEPIESVQNSNTLSHQSLRPIILNNSTFGDMPCRVYFKNLDDIMIKFFLKETLENQLNLLISLNPPKQVVQSLANIGALFQARDASLVENKIINKIVQIQKIGMDELMIEKFLSQFAILQKYFYSPEFIQKCQQ